MSSSSSASPSSLELSQKSGKSTFHKKRKRPTQKPPRRLSWPTSLSQNSNGNNMDDTLRRKSDGNNNVSFKKRARFSAPLQSSNSTKKPHHNDNVIWVQKYTPKSSDDLCVAPKKVKEIKAWIEQGNTIHNKQKLLVLVGSPGIGKSTCIRVLAQEMCWNVMSWNETHNPRDYGSSSFNMFGVEQTSALDSFHEFLQQSGSGFSSLAMNDDTQNSFPSKSLILLEELPNLHGPDAELKFRTMMKEHLQQSQVPTILIFSDVSEGKHNPDDLERLIDPEDLYDNACTTILQINAVTKPKMKKVLAAIAKQERCSVSPAYLEELHSQSRGDLRHAIMTLQLQASGTSVPSTGSLSHGTNKRDDKLSTFHSLGKMLYAKRKMENGVSRLDFDPDTLLERCDMGVEGSLKFLEYHSLDFFTDIADISKAHEYFSDSIELLDRSVSSSGNAHGYAAAVAGRAVAVANKHPTANRFRQFSRPKAFDVIRNGKQNKVLLEQLSRRISAHHGPMSSTVGGDTGTFVTESLPFVRNILPHEVDPLVSNLYSIAMSRYQISNTNTNVLGKEEDKNLREQEKILAADDIQDYDSDNE